jgi:hypothetical protein
MNSLRLSRLFARERNDLTAWQVVQWWESRRFAYNLLVGLAGLFTCVIAVLAAVIVESVGGRAVLPDPPLFALIGVFFYGVAANICYTGGWFCELVSRRLWPAEAAAFGRLSFTFGLIGSVLLTLVPAVFVIVFSVIEMFAQHSTVQ